jgi:tetratricopeptide (TPR) repeat protein
LRMEFPVDWSAVGSLLGCDPGTSPFRAIAVILGGMASLTTIVAALYQLWRWWQGPNPTQRRAARALRQQGWFRHRLKHRTIAMELYNYSIKLNPRAGQVYYVRGCLFEELGNLNRAIADWRRCIAQLPRHHQALRKLAEHGHVAQTPSHWRLAYGAAVLAALLILAGFLYVSTRSATAQSFECNDAVTNLNYAVSGISTALPSYTRCISNSAGRDECTSEFHSLQVAQDSFQWAVRRVRDACRLY